MKLAEVDKFDELFTHVDDKTGVQTSYNVTRLYEYVSAHESEVEAVSVPVEEQHAQYCLDNRGVEKDRIKVLLENPTYCKKPILFIHLTHGDGTHLLVDGTHRYVIYHWAKVPTIPAYIVPWDVAVPFVVEDAVQVEEDKLMEWSGISVIRKIQQEQES